MSDATVRARTSAWLLCALGLIGCSGTIEPGPADDHAPGTGASPATSATGPGLGNPRSGPAGPGASGPSAALASACPAGATPQPLASSTPLRRLSHAQYLGVLADVLAGWAPALASQVLGAPAVASALAQLPDDDRVTGSSDKRGGSRRLDQGVQQDLVDASLAVAQAVAAELTSSSARVATLLGTCASDADPSNDAACVQAFIQRAGRLAHRRKLEADDVAFYTSVYAAPGIDARGLADVITVLLTNPYFFYQVEHGGEVVDAGQRLYALDAQELANRLSLHFLGTIPDAALTALVDSGGIVTDGGYAQALAHVTSHPRARDMLGELFRDFFSVEDLPEMNQNIGVPRFDALRGSFMPTAATRRNMIDEVTRLAVHYALAPDGKLADLFTTRKSFATTADLAQIYGTTPWSGSGEPPDMPDAEHVGVLTHAGLVASGAAVTRPIIKGVVVRNVLLCESIPPPPADAMAIAAQTQATLPPLSSTRAQTVALTESMPACSGCHARLINPLGFPTEGFDSLGRVRQVERVFTDKGTVLGQVAVDRTSVPNVVEGDGTPVSNAAELQALLLASKKVQACLAAKYFRFTFAQREDAVSDACTLATIADGLVQGKPLGQVLFQVANTRAFKQRRFN
jgi:hypothetical protein